MGSSSSVDARGSHRTGEFSSFYIACRDGNINFVCDKLPKMTYDQVNRIEPNGSTALHAACYYNRAQIVKMLLDSSCARNILNQYGRTAFEDATSDEIRRLFERPTSDRFVSEEMAKSFDLVTNKGDNAKTEIDAPDDWFKGHKSVNDATESNFMKTFGESNGVLKSIVKRQIQSWSAQHVKKLMDQTIPKNDNNHQAANGFYKNFLKKTKVANLLSLYTMETPFYHSLTTDADDYTALIYLNLDQLQSRAFRGVTYRGGTMAQKDLDAYRWASTNKAVYVLESRVLQSTSTNIEVAQGFASKDQDTLAESGKYSTLFKFNFPKTCSTAIDLRRISEQMPSLSVYEGENEVLVLPFTLFKVINIKVDSMSGQYRILLKNVPAVKQSLLTAAKQLAS